MPEANTFNLLFYGFNLNQAKRFDSSLNIDSFYITTDFLKQNESARLIQEQRFIPKNLLEIQGTDEFNQIYSEVLKFYSYNKNSLPYERIDSFNLSSNLILSSLHLTTRGFLNSIDDSVHHFRQVFNVAVYLFESMRFKLIIMRTGPQSIFSNLLFHLASHFNCKVIYGEPINYGPHRWMLNTNKKSSIESGLNPNLDPDQINTILDEIFSKDDLSPDRSNINSISFKENSLRLFIKILRNLSLNFINIGYRFFSYSFYFLKNYFNSSKNYFAYHKKYPSRVYWKAHLKDLLRSVYLHIFYALISYLDWRKLDKEEDFVVLLANYQPEKTSNPDSLTYFDLRNLAESVKVRTDKDTRIVYKEHPSTLFRLMKESFPRLGTLYRSIAFYKDLRKLGLIISPIEVDTEDLILNSKGIYCLTSTAILNLNIGSTKHSNFLELPINVFGDRWFSQLKNIISFEDNGQRNEKGKLSLRDLLNQQLSNGFYSLGEPGAYNEKVVDSLIPEIKDILKKL